MKGGSEMVLSAIDNKKQIEPLCIHPSNNLPSAFPFRFYLF